MLTQKLFDVASTGDIQAIEDAFKNDTARFVKKAIRKAKKAMRFTAAKTLGKYLTKLGVQVQAKEKSVDLAKYPVHLKVTVNTGDNEVNGLVVGTINRVGIIASQETTKNGDVVDCNMKTNDAKLLMERAEEIQGLTIEKLPKK